VANTVQAKKRARQADKRNAHNVAARSAIRTAMKRVVKACATGDHATASAAYKAAVPTIDKGVSKGYVHRNAAARYKSRLNARVHALAA
jgi:small subunit ribosomal protein S20